MVASTRLVDYLGIDIAANLPDPMTFTISPNAIAFFWASDTDVLYMFDQSVPEWVDIAAAMGANVSFIGLADTPAAYTGAGGKLLAVNVGESGIEFVDAPTTLPIGGTIGQVLTKLSAVDGDADWVDPIGATALDDLTDVDLTTPPTDNQVLQFDSVSSLWKPETLPPAGAPWYFAPPAAADFTLATGSGSANLTLTDDADAGLLISDANAPTAGDDWRLAYKAAAAGVDWTLTAKIDYFAQNINYSNIGIGIWDSVSGKLVALEATIGASVDSVRVTHYTAIGGTWAASPLTFEIRGTRPLWKRLRYIHGTTTINYEISVDGKNWLTVYSASITAYLDNPPDRVFIGFSYNRSTGFPLRATCEHWSQSW